MASALALASCSGPDRSASGIVTGIETLGLGRVQSFRLRTQAGDSLEFTIDGPVALDGAAFPPDHLRAHMATAEGITVAYRTDGDVRVVVRLTDAP